MSFLTSVNPATEEFIKEYAEHTDREVDDLLFKSNEAFKEWSKLDVCSRAKNFVHLANILKEEKKELAKLITLEMGKTLEESLSEIEKCALVCEYYAENTEEFLKNDNIFTDATESYVSFRPLGTIFAIMPWNFPFWQVFRFAVPSLVAGNTAVLKHASNVTGCALAIEDLFTKAGFPSGAFNTLIINSKKVNRVIENKYVHAVTLTGSTKAGKSVAKKAGEQLKKVVLELGGSDAYLVLKDADIDDAAEKCLKSRLINSGQSCIAAKRFIVEEDVFDNFVEKILEKAKKITDIGPMAKNELREELHSQVKESIKKGAECLLGGEMSGNKGFYYPVTILTNITKDMPVYREEVFGPVLSIIKVKDVDEAVKVANDSPFGLGAAVFTSDKEKGKEIAEYRLHAGSTFVNDFVRSDPRLPFGGIKNSGFGRELSYLGIKEFVNQKTVYIK